MAEAAGAALEASGGEPAADGGKRYAYKRKGDVNAPRRPQTTFFRWLTKNRAKLQAECETKDRKVFSQHASQRWKEVSESVKQKYQAKWEREMETYRQELESYKATEAYRQYQADKRQQRAPRARQPPPREDAPAPSAPAPGAGARGEEEEQPVYLSRVSSRALLAELTQRLHSRPEPVTLAADVRLLLLSALAAQMPDDAREAACSPSAKEPPGGAGSEAEPPARPLAGGAAVWLTARRRERIAAELGTEEEEEVLEEALRRWEALGEEARAKFEAKAAERGL